MTIIYYILGLISGLILGAHFNQKIFEKEAIKNKAAKLDIHGNFEWIKREGEDEKATRIN